MIIFGKKKKNEDSESLRALQDRYDMIVAERKSLYSLVDKLTGYCEGLEKLINTQRVGIETLEDRVTSLEVAIDSLKEELNAYGRQDNVSGVSE